jgi:endoglucanase
MTVSNIKLIASIFLSSLILFAIIITPNVSLQATQLRINSSSLLNLAVKSTWSNYTDKFIINSGQVLDHDQNYTTSEGQSYAMLRAVWTNDKKAFENVWQWTKNNLQKRSEDKLIAWRMRKDSSGNFNQLDSMNATDADLDIALALILAHKRWSRDKQSSFLLDGVELIKNVWKHRVVDLQNGSLAILPFNSQKWRNIEILNPSYFSPAHYRVFAQFDKSNNWNKLSNDTYTILNKISSDKGLVPNWIKYDYSKKDFSSAVDTMNESNANNYGYDAFRVFWRVGLDVSWFNTKGARNFLRKALPFFTQEYKNNNRIVAVYDLNGNKLENYEDTATDTAAYMVFKYTNSPLLSKFWNEKYINSIDKKTNIFKVNSNYYSQNWGWFTLADRNNLIKQNISRNR